MNTNPYREPGALRLSTLAALLGVALAGVPATADEVPDAIVSGRVLGAEIPVSEAQVYAYEVASLDLRQVMTDEAGRFLFKALPAGLYKIIAHKAGFVPSVELLLRRTDDARQFVEMQLQQQASGDVRAAESYWDARSRIPADVLRQIETLNLRRAEGAGATLDGASLFAAEMEAGGGVASLGTEQGTAHMAEAAVGMRGNVGGVQFGFDGSYQLLTPEGELAAGLPGGESRSMAFQLESSREDQVRLLTATGEFVNLSDRGFEPVGMNNYQLSWSGPTGEGNSGFSAQVIDELNYFRGTDPRGADLPKASRTVNVQGSYSRAIGSTALETGVQYRQRATGEAAYYGDEDEEIAVYGQGGTQAHSRVLVEYGLYSSMRDGGLSVVPQGGMVVQLGDDWTARTSVAQRLDRQDGENPMTPGFYSAFYNDGTSCREAGESCYEVMFAQESANDEKLMIGAIHRKYAETLRLYFSDDFFNRLESLMVVPGDEIPELRFSMVRRITPRILAKLESNIASGGGGIFYATDETAYQNEVRYLVTSLDTRFQTTSTGVFLAFHYLEQGMSPLGETTQPSAPEVEVQRLQVMLTQDLSALMNLPTNWAVRLNMELSRGANPYTLTVDDELHKKLTGGVSVSF